MAVHGLVNALADYYTLPRSKKEPVSEWSQLKRGDHICWNRSLYEHHAILISAEASKKRLCVIEYGGNFDNNPGSGLASILWSSSEAKGVVLEREEEIEDFGEARLFRFIYNDPKDCLEPDEVIERARSRIGEKEYHLIGKNCEHFATWCKTGKAFSRQANAASAAVDDLYTPTPTPVSLAKIVYNAFLRNQ